MGRGVEGFFKGGIHVGGYIGNTTKGSCVLKGGGGVRET